MKTKGSKPPALWTGTLRSSTEAPDKVVEEVVVHLREDHTSDTILTGKSLLENKREIRGQTDEMPEQDTTQDVLLVIQRRNDEASSKWDELEAPEVAVSPGYTRSFTPPDRIDNTYPAGTKRPSGSPVR